MSITEMLKTFIVSFQICDRLFVIITMTSLGSRERPFPHGVRCEVCQKQLSSDNKESYLKEKNHGKRVTFWRYNRIEMHVKDAIGTE